MKKRGEKREREVSSKFSIPEMSLPLTSLPFTRKLEIEIFLISIPYQMTRNRGLCTHRHQFRTAIIAVTINRIAISVELNRIRTMIDRLSCLGKGGREGMMKY